MKINPQTVALNIAASQCFRLSEFLFKQSEAVDYYEATALTADQVKQMNEELSSLFFELAELVELTAKSCQNAATPELPTPKIQN
jgi:hypothetical protein